MKTVHVLDRLNGCMSWYGSPLAPVPDVRSEDLMIMQ